MPGPKQFLLEVNLFFPSFKMFSVGVYINIFLLHNFFCMHILKFLVNNFCVHILKFLLNNFVELLNKIFDSVYRLKFFTE